MVQLGHAIFQLDSEVSRRTCSRHRLDLVCSLMALCVVAPFLRGADRCADARDDIQRAQRLIGAGRNSEGRRLIDSAFMACPADVQNLELLAEAYDSLQDFSKAGLLRGQVFRLRGISAKPTADFSATPSTFERGQMATLTWTAKYASEVEITPDLGRVAAHGSKAVGPLNSTSYQLRATGPGGTLSATVSLTVTQARLNQTDVLELVKNGVATLRVAQVAAQRGVSFDMTAQTEHELRNAGADDALIEALRKARR